MLVELSSHAVRKPSYERKIGFTASVYRRMRDSGESRELRIIVSFWLGDGSEDGFFGLVTEALKNRWHVTMQLGVPGTPDEGLAVIKIDKERGPLICRKLDNQAIATFCIPKPACRIPPATISKVWTQKFGENADGSITVVIPKEIRPITDEVATYLAKAMSRKGK